MKKFAAILVFTLITIFLISNYCTPTFSMPKGVKRKRTSQLQQELKEKERQDAEIARQHGWSPGSLKHLEFLCQMSSPKKAPTQREQGVIDQGIVLLKKIEETAIQGLEDASTTIVSQVEASKEELIASTTISPPKNVNDLLIAMFEGSIFSRDLTSFWENEEPSPEIEEKPQTPFSHTLSRLGLIDETEDLSSTSKRPSKRGRTMSPETFSSPYKTPERPTQEEESLLTPSSRLRGIWVSPVKPSPNGVVTEIITALSTPLTQGSVTSVRPQSPPRLTRFRSRIVNPNIRRVLFP